MKSHRFSGEPQLIKVETGKLLLSKGSSGDGVGRIQLVLHLLNYPLPRSIKQGRPDGIFGSETDGAIRQFQQKFELKPDGMVGPKTLGRLDNLLIERPCFDTNEPAAYGALVLAKSSGPRESRLVYHT